MRRSLVRAVSATATLAVVAVLSGCARLLPVQPEDLAQPVELSVASGAVRFDPAEIVAARIEDDMLHLDVRFGGGCREHHFSLLQTGVFRESHPVQTDLRLAHDANGDMCRALLSRSLTFDLTPLKQAYQAAYATPKGVIMLYVYAPAASAPERPVRYAF